MLCKLCCNKRLMAVIVFILTLAILFNFGVKPIVEAKAFALSATAIALISSLLTTVGISCVASEDLRALVNKTFAAMGENLKANIDRLASSISTTGTIGTVNIPPSVLYEMIEIRDKMCPSDQTSIPADSLSGGMYAPISYRNSSLLPFLPMVSDEAWDVIGQYKYCDIRQGKAFGTRDFIEFTLFNDEYYNPTENFFYYSDGKFQIKGKNSYKILSFYIDNGTFKLSEDSSYWGISDEYYTLSGVARNIFCSYDKTWGFMGSTFHITAASPSDVITTVPIPYVVNKSLVEGGAFVKALDNVIAGNPDYVGSEILVLPNVEDYIGVDSKDILVDKTLSKEIEKVQTNVAEGEISIPKIDDISLPEKITTVFPFSIPWDIARGLSVFMAEPVAPRFEIPFKYQNVVDTSMVLDFTQFDFLIRLLRWGELAVFIVGLAMMTRKVIKW